MVPLPEKIADFDIIRRIGAGGMAEVFLAKKRGAEGTYKWLVVKRVLPTFTSSRRFRNMFVEEAHLATRLNHPNIVQVYEFIDHSSDGLLLSMEYVEGVDLGKLLSAARQKGQSIPVPVALFIIAEAAKGLHYAHERKDDAGTSLCIVHRDVSPQNILLSFDGTVKIADFGIASANMFREEQGILKGKFAYMSPEQARGEKVDRRSDIYALGVVLYELIALRSPSGKLDDDALIEAVKHHRIESLQVPNLDPDIEAIVHKALHSSVEHRFQSAREMAATIARALLAKQELVDSASVESVISSLVPRSDESSSAASDQPQTLAAVPLARISESVEPFIHNESRHAREVRHVSIVTMRIHGIHQLSTKPRAIEAIRSILNDIAYKRGAIWSWENPQIARAVVGLLDNPSRAALNAARLALDTHEALSGASEDLPEKIRASIGIVRGIATGERDRRGHLMDHQLAEPANYLADKLGSCAPFGKTWVAGGVYRLVRRDFRWNDAPTLILDEASQYGIPPQMRIYSLERSLTRDERLGELAAWPDDLVGRDAERADLHAAYHHSVSPPSITWPPPSKHHPDLARFRGTLVSRVIVGEMGIGKTALITTFLEEIPREARVVHLEVAPVQSELPYAAVADLLRIILDLSVNTPLQEAIETIEIFLGTRPNMERVIPRLAELVTGRSIVADDDSSIHIRDTIAAGTRSVLGVMARVQPVVIVVDGLQWADRPSLEILRILLHRRENVPILVLLVTRPEERVASTIEALVRLELRGLSKDEQTRLVQVRLGVQRGVTEVCAELLPRVAGNPFFLLEMIDTLLEKGRLEIVESIDGTHELVRHESTTDSLEELPSTLEQLIGDRLRELPSEETDIVNWLAVAGGPLTENDLLSLTRLVNAEPITRLCARGLCDRKLDRVDFRYPIARDVAYMALSPSERAKMHRVLGEHLSSTPLAHGLSAAIVARHLARGESASEAADYYLEAANSARFGHQAQLALRYYNDALAILRPGDIRQMIALEALETIYRNLGRRRERKQNLEALRKAARDHGHAQWACLALVRTARMHLDEGLLAQGLPVAEQAAEVAKMAKQPAILVEAHTILSEILRELGNTQGAIQHCEMALQVAQSHHVAPRTRADVLRAKGILLRRAGRLKDAVESYAEAIAVFKAVGARRSEARTRNALAFAMMVLERFEDAIALALESISIHVSIGGRFQIAKTLSNIGQAYARLGDYDRGLSYLKQAREAHERYQDQDSRADTLLHSALVLVEAGDIFKATTLCGDASALVSATGSVYDTILERIVRSVLACAVSDYDLSASLANDARQRAEAQGLMSYYLYSTALEAMARAELFEMHNASVLARTALGTMDAMGGCEYNVEVLNLIGEVLLTVEPDAATNAVLRGYNHVQQIHASIRDVRLKPIFWKRPLVQNIVARATKLGLTEEVHGASSQRGTA